MPVCVVRKNITRLSNHSGGSISVKAPIIDTNKTFLPNGIAGMVGLGHPKPNNVSQTIPANQAQVHYGGGALHSNLKTLHFHKQDKNIKLLL